MAFTINQVYSENPYADIVVYYAKLLGIDTVLKMKDVADQNETEESLKNADLYIACMENTAIWELFDSFPEEVLRASGLTGQALVNAMMSKDAIPRSMRATVLDNMKAYVVANYEELNNYYRMLNGLPPVGYTNVYATENDILTVPSTIEVDLSIPVHEMNAGMIELLDNYDVLDTMYAEDPENRGYLRYLDKKISPYAARKASAFAPLYVPTIDSTELSDEYKDRLEINRRYAITAIYSQAYKYESDYYDNFIAVFIILNTMVDMISRIQEFIARKEVFDLRTCRYIFESYGVEFFPRIPLRYQILMVKNLHQLLKYKSTAHCMINICQLFGFDNITIFKYYLLRNRKSSKNGVYSFTGVDEEDFDLKFVKIPIDEPMDDYIRDPTYQVGYDEITSGDATWDGGLDHDYVKRQHQSLSFNYTRTKYLSVDAMYELAEIATQQAYFFNMLYDNVELEEEITVQVPLISETPIQVADLFTFLTVLTFKYYGIKDTMLDTASKVLTVNGFNFHADLAELAALFDKFDAHNKFTRIKGKIRANARSIDPDTGETLLADKAIKTAQEALEDFILPTDQIPSFAQLMNIFRNNLDVREVLIQGMKDADNKRIYETYKTLYDSLMTMELTMDHFANPETGELYRDAEGDATYEAYLMNENPTLYYKLVELELIDDEDTRIQQISNIIDNAVFVLEQWIDRDEFPGIFHNLPAVSVDAIKEYIQMVVDFYKSYKVHFLGVNTIYTFDDDYEGWIRIIDDALLNRKFWKRDIVPVIDQIAAQLNEITKVDKVHIRERIYMDIKTWVYKDIVDRCWLKDGKYSIDYLTLFSRLLIEDTQVYTSILEYEDKIPMLDIQSALNISMTVEDHYRPFDRAYYASSDDWQP